MKKILTNQAPQAIGPYSQAVQVGNFIFISGQLPIDPETGDFSSNDIVEQTKQVMKNIKGILESQNLDIKNLVKTNIYVKDLNNFKIVNDTYATCLEGHEPARAVVEVNRLPKDAQIEIEAIAYLN